MTFRERWARAASCWTSIRVMDQYTSAAVSTQYPEILKPPVREALLLKNLDTRTTSYALTILPLFRHWAQTRMRLLPEPTLARTGRRFTFQRRLVTLWAWLMLFPACGFLPQIAQICAINFPTLRSNSEGLTAKGNFRAWCVKGRFYRSSALSTT